MTEAEWATFAFAVGMPVVMVACVIALFWDAARGQRRLEERIREIYSDD